MKIIGARPRGWWMVAKLARGDYCVSDLYELSYKRDAIYGSKVYVIEPYPARRVSDHYFAVDDVKKTLQDAITASNVVAHEFMGNVIGFTAKSDVLNIEATAPIFDSMENIELTYELLKLAGFKVQKPEAIWRSIIANIPPWIKLMDDSTYKRMMSDLVYHHEQVLRLAAEIGRYEAKAKRHRTKDIEIQMDMLRDEPLIEDIELRPYRLIIYTKPITVRDEKTGYEWTNSYEIELDIMKVDGGRAIKIRGEKVVDDLYHPHIKGNHICASAITDATRELAKGNIYNAVMLVLNILQSYDVEHGPYATIQHMVERMKELEEVVEQ